MRRLGACGTHVPVIPSVLEELIFHVLSLSMGGRQSGVLLRPWVPRATRLSSVPASM